MTRCSPRCARERAGTARKPRAASLRTRAQTARARAAATWACSAKPSTTNSLTKRVPMRTRPLASISTNSHPSLARRKKARMEVAQSCQESRLRQNAQSSTWLRAMTRSAVPKNQREALARPARSTRRHSVDSQLRTHPLNSNKCSAANLLSHSSYLRSPKRNKLKYPRQKTKRSSSKCPKKNSMPCSKNKLRCRTQSKRATSECAL